jgi:hypothetical protein
LERDAVFASANGHFHIQLNDRPAANGLIDALRANNFEIEALNVKKRSLEAVFIERVSE